MADFTYDLDLEPIQQSIIDFIESEWPGTPVYPDGLVDDETVDKFDDGSVKPYFILWLRDLNRSPRGRSFGGTRMDSYRSGFDLVAVTNNGSESRRLLNLVSNKLIGWKPLNSGEVVKGNSLWEGSRAVKDSANRPSRFVSTGRFDFGVFQRRSDLP